MNNNLYISKIYMWKEITGDALPKFDNINDAPDVWTWEVVKKDLDLSMAFGDEISIALINEATAKLVQEFESEIMRFLDLVIGK